jgi:hypothetical protein
MRFSSCLKKNENKRQKREKIAEWDFLLTLKTSNGSKRGEGKKGAKWDL